MKGITIEIIRLTMSGKKPAQIAVLLNTTAEAVRMAVYRQRKIATSSLCFFTGQPAQFPAYYEGKIIYVCNRWYKILQSGLESEDCFVYLKHSDNYRAFPIELLKNL